MIPSANIKSYTLFDTDENRVEDTWAASLKQGRPRTYAEAAKQYLPAPNPPVTQVVIRATERPKYPALIVEKLPNKNYHFGVLKKIIGQYPSVKILEKCVKFTPRTELEYNILYKYLAKLEKEEHIAWIVQSLPAY